MTSHTTEKAAKNVLMKNYQSSSVETKKTQTSRPAEGRFHHQFGY